MVRGAVRGSPRVLASTELAVGRPISAFRHFQWAENSIPPRGVSKPLQLPYDPGLMRRILPSAAIRFALIPGLVLIESLALYTLVIIILQVK